MTDKTNKPYLRNLSLLMLLFCFACTQNTERAAEETTDARQAIEEGNRQFMEAWEAGDAAAVASLYTENALFLAPHVEPIQGRQAIEAYVSGAFEAGLQRIKLETTEFNRFGNIGHETGRYTLYAVNGMQVDHGKYIIIWKRQNGEWKIHWDMFNTSVPRNSMNEEAQQEEQ